MTKSDKEVVLELKRRLPLKALSHLKNLIIFGSRARGEGGENSDLDVIALVDEKTVDLEQIFSDVIYDIMWDHDFRPIVSLKVFTENQFRTGVKKGFSFYRNVEKEGVSVFQ